MAAAAPCHWSSEEAMQYRMTSRRRKPRGNTAPQQGETQGPSPRAPHERDESADSQRSGDPTQGRMRSGAVDTGKAPAMDETYKRLSGSDPKDKFNP
jgi:hypothetical protein